MSKVVDPRAFEGSYIENPEAVGDLNQTPILHASEAMRAFLNPCGADTPSRGGYCGGVNGFHATDCPTLGGAS